MHHCSVLCSPLFTLISTDNFFEKFCSVCANSLVDLIYHELNHVHNKSKDPNIIRYVRCDSVLEDNNIGQALASCKNTN